MRHAPLPTGTMQTDSTPRIEPPDIVTVRQSWLPRALLWMALVMLGLAAFGMYLRYRPLVFDSARWQLASGFDRGRMLKSLLGQTDFVGFTRAEVETYLGRANFDERLFWYDLGKDTTHTPIDRRANVGSPVHLYGVFRCNRGGVILEVLYSHRRPILGSRPFDSTGWFSHNPVIRRAMFTHALGKLRTAGLTRQVALRLLGPPDGSRIRGQYDVGSGGIFFGTKKALVLEYNRENVVTSSFVSD